MLILKNCDMDFVMVNFRFSMGDLLVIVGRTYKMSTLNLKRRI